MQTQLTQWNTRPPGLPRSARVQQFIVENYRTRTLVLDLALSGEPGQFVMAWLPDVGEKPFSLAGVDPLRLTIANVGPFSAAMQALRPGSRVGILGPYGHGFRPAGRRALLVGGGYGVAPLAFLAERLLAHGTHVQIAIGARSAEDLLLVERLERMGLQPLLATEDGSRGVRGRVTALTAPILARGEVDQMYACGPHPMLEALELAARQANVPAQLSWEARMNCGMGLCGSCEHHGVRLCVEGPVLASDKACCGGHG